MFNLKFHARRSLQLVTVGASVASLASAALAVTPQFDNVYFDPGNTGAPVGSGGNGSFSNSTANFYNTRLSPPDVTIFVPANQNQDASHAGYWSGDLVHFATTGGNVSLLANTSLKAISFDVGGYTIGTAGGPSLTIGAGIGAYEGGNGPVDFLRNVSGDNTINAQIFVPLGTTAKSFNINIQSGSLTLHAFKNGPTTSGGSYGDIHKTGSGTLRSTGVFDAGKIAQTELFIDAGTVELSSPATVGTTIGNQVCAAIEVASNATISGDGGVKITSALGSPHFRIKAGGHLAPGDNPNGATSGAVGKFTLIGPTTGSNFTANLDASSNLDLDIASLSSYDSFQLTCGTYANSTASLAGLVNISALAPLQPGTYHIITETPGQAGQFVPITDSGLAIGSAPAGYQYSLDHVLGGVGGAQIIGIDLVVVPEPASLALLGLGSVLLLTRKRRKPCP